MKAWITSNNPSRLKRNVVLAIFLSLIIIVNTGTAILFILNILGIAERSAYLPEWMVFFSTLVCMGNVVCALAVWFWRRWGVIGYGVLTVLAYLVTAIATRVFTNLFGLVGFIILVLLIYPYWKYMK